MGIDDSRELEEKPEYKVLYSYVTDDPRGMDNVVLHVLRSRSFGFPIQFQETRKTPFYGRYPVMVNSEETKEKVDKIFNLAFYYNIYHVLCDAAGGEPNMIVKHLREGKAGKLYDWPIPSLVLIKKPLDERVLKRCYMLAYERNVEKDTVFSPYFRPTRFDLPWLKIWLKLKGLYERLEREGFRPIDSEAMGILMIPVVREILEQHPELKP